MKKALKILKTAGLVGLLAYIALFLVFFFDLDGKLLFYVVEPFLCKHYDAMERKNPFDQPYDQVAEGEEYVKGK